MDKIDHQPLLDTQQSQLVITLDTSSGLENKALALFAANVAILIFLGEGASTLVAWQAALLLGPFFLALVIIVFALVPRSYVGAGIDLDEHPEYLGLDKDDLLLQLLANTKYAIQENTRLNRVLWRYCVSSFALSVLGALMIFILL